MKGREQDVLAESFFVSMWGKIMFTWIILIIKFYKCSHTHWKQSMHNLHFMACCVPDLNLTSKVKTNGPNFNIFVQRHFARLQEDWLFLKYASPPPPILPQNRKGAENRYRIFEGVVSYLYGNITSASLTGAILPLGAAPSSALRDPPSEWARRTFRNEENSDLKSSTWVNGLVIFVFWSVGQSQSDW